MIGPWRGNDPKPPRQPRPRFSPPTPTNYDKPDNPTGQSTYAAGKRQQHRDDRQVDALGIDWAAAGAALRDHLAKRDGIAEEQPEPTDWHRRDGGEWEPWEPGE